jgi:hypothetical protein
MILTWIHDQAIGRLTCTINENLQYITENGGESLTKIFNGEEIELNGFEDWEDEKHWLSDNFSDQLGTYAPQWDITEESWQADNPDWTGAVPLFGITPAGEYLDKLARTSTFQEGRDMTDAFMDTDKRLHIELDQQGNYWRREWCEERGEFYNVQPCCVFPNNPGRTALTAEQAEQLINDAAE